MIITIEEAQAIDSSFEREDIEALESAIREITNNNFHSKVRFRVDHIEEPNLIHLTQQVRGVRQGDRIELNNSLYNDSLHTVEEIDGQTLKVDTDDLFEEPKSGMIVTLIRYPADVKRGVKKLLEYETKTANNIGVKSRSISRVTETYFDVTSGENVNGYPSSLFAFIKKYKRIGWGT